MPGQLISGVPVLISNDFDRTVDFYQRFNFQEVARYTQGYLILRRDGLELHFIPRHDQDPKDSWHSAYVRVLNVKALTEEWKDIKVPDDGISRYTPATLREWGMIEAYIIDPDGNLLKLGAANEETAL